MLIFTLTQQPRIWITLHGHPQQVNTYNGLFLCMIIYLMVYDIRWQKMVT